MGHRSYWKILPDRASLFCCGSENVRLSRHPQNTNGPAHQERAASNWMDRRNRVSRPNFTGHQSSVAASKKGENNTNMKRYLVQGTIVSLCCYMLAVVLALTVLQPAALALGSCGLACDDQCGPSFTVDYNCFCLPNSTDCCTGTKHGNVYEIHCFDISGFACDSFECGWGTCEPNCH